MRVFKKKPNYRGGEVLRITEECATSQSHINHICYKIICTAETLSFCPEREEIIKILKEIMSTDCKNSNYKEAINSIKTKREKLVGLGDFVRKSSKEKYNLYRKNLRSLFTYISP